MFFDYCLNSVPSPFYFPSPSRKSQINSAPWLCLLIRFFVSNHSDQFPSPSLKRQKKLHAVITLPYPLLTKKSFRIQFAISVSVSVYAFTYADWFWYKRSQNTFPLLLKLFFLSWAIVGLWIKLNNHMQIVFCIIKDPIPLM